MQMLAMGISVVADLLGCGSKLQDQVVVPAAYKATLHFAITSSVAEAGLFFA